MNLTLACWALTFLWQQAALPEAAPPVAVPGASANTTPTPAVRVLPGLQADGRIQLPNQWSLRPAGQQIPVGDFPVQLELHPTGKWLAVLHAGMGMHEVVLIDLAKSRISGRATLEQTFHGMAFNTNGTELIVSSAEYPNLYRFACQDGTLSKMPSLRVDPTRKDLVFGGLCLSPTEPLLYVCATWGHRVYRVPVPHPDRPAETLAGAAQAFDLPKESYPFTCRLVAGQQKLAVSLWNKSAVALLNLTTGQWEDTLPTDRHPTEMVANQAGTVLYVSCANSTKVTVLDVVGKKTLQTIDCALYPESPSGNTPNSLCLSADEQLLVVANADTNYLALFDVTNPQRAMPLGSIPTGWYPTSVRLGADKTIYVSNGKGIRPKSNRHGPNPNLGLLFRSTEEYIGRLFQGTVAIIPYPTSVQLEQYSKRTYLCAPLRPKFTPVIDEPLPAQHPIPQQVGAPSPIKYCFYVIKENRTYDQVFGDIPEGNGDPSLCLFPEKVTPNHHRLAKQFVLLDNFYVESEVSADGHEWTMGAYATDFVERMWPLVYRGSPFKKLTYPAEGANDPLARPAGGYIWDRCQAKGVSYFSFGEWVDNGPTPADPARATVPALEGHFDPYFRTYDLSYPDVKRAERFITKLREWESAEPLAVPQLTILRLPNDHTAGTVPGRPTPTAFLADNDYALGMVVEAISKSKIWPQSAIFVVEDDAQNGPDHVDAHRTVALVISPYTKRQAVDSSMYSTSSMLRTIELILGLEPMSQFDAAARPMFASFQVEPNLTPYEAVEPAVDRTATNPKDAWGAELSASFNLDREDAADDILLNEVVWRSVRGPNVPMPAPVRAAFLKPLAEAEDEDD